MSRFAKLTVAKVTAAVSVATVAATLLLIALGGFVRAMEAGLGCPDWPTCHGSLNPPSSLSWGDLKLAWIEHSHRLWASVVVALIVAQAVVVRRARLDRRVQVVSWALVPVVLSQAVLGAIVVWLKLDAQSVLLHLAGALTVLGMAIYVALHALGRGRPASGSSGLSGLSGPPAPSGLGGLALLTLVVTLGQMLLGSAVTGWAAGLAYGTFPSFNGRVLPPVVDNPQQWLHVSHRFVAYLLAVLVVAVFARSRRSAEPLVRRTGALALALVAVQIGLGAANIWFHLPAWSVAPHLAVGSWLVAALFVLTLRAHWTTVPVGATAARSSRAVPEAGAA